MKRVIEKLLLIGLTVIKGVWDRPVLIMASENPAALGPAGRL